MRTKTKARPPVVLPPKKNGSCIREWDTSIPLEYAHKHLGRAAESMTLDEMAQQLSLVKYPDEPITVRDPSKRPIPHSAVYRNGEPTGSTPYFVAHC